jgi:hypothetical protein
MGKRETKAERRRRDRQWDAMPEAARRKTERLAQIIVLMEAVGEVAAVERDRAELAALLTRHGVEVPDAR